MLILRNKFYGVNSLKTAHDILINLMMQEDVPQNFTKIYVDPIA